MSKVTELPLKSWQFFHACRVILGPEVVGRICGRCKRQAYRWAADPRYCDNVERNPIDWLGDLFEMLIEIGRRDIVLAGLRTLAEKANTEVKDLEPCCPDKETIAEECLDDYPAVSAFHTAIREGQDTKEVQRRKEAAIREIEETFRKFLEQPPKEDLESSWRSYGM